MYKLFIDKNELFEAKIELEGASIDETFARLVMNTDKWNLVFEGDIDNKGNVKIPINRLKNIFTEDISGNLKLEIVAEDTYFIPWEDEFELDRSKKVTVEVKQRDVNKKKIVEDTKPKVTIKENKKKEFKVTERLAKSYLREIMKASLKSETLIASKSTIKEITNNFIKENSINPSNKKDLYELIRESKGVIINAVRNIRK